MVLSEVNYSFSDFEYNSIYFLFLIFYSDSQHSPTVRKIYLISPGEYNLQPHNFHRSSLNNLPSKTNNLIIGELELHSTLISSSPFKTLKEIIILQTVYFSLMIVSCMNFLRLFSTPKIRGWMIEKLLFPFRYKFRSGISQSGLGKEVSLFGFLYFLYIHYPCAKCFVCFVIFHLFG